MGYVQGAIRSVLAFVVAPLLFLSAMQSDAGYDDIMLGIHATFAGRVACYNGTLDPDEENFGIEECYTGEIPDEPADDLVCDEGAYLDDERGDEWFPADDYDTRD